MNRRVSSKKQFVGCNYFTMDISQLERNLDFISLTGNVLNDEKRMILTNSLILLQNENQFTKIYLWGKILGLEFDYFIAYGFKKSVLFGRVFYYSTNGMDWGILPKVADHVLNLALISQTNFHGDPSLVINIATDGYEGFNVVKPNEDETEGLTLKEEDRLSAIVTAITQESQILPRGSFIRRFEDGQIVINPNFKGLDGEEGKQFRNYFHLRAPVFPWNTNVVTAQKINTQLDCLDSIDVDFPPGCWSLQIERGETVAVLRSLYWPGSVSFHVFNTPHYGFLYIGSGKRNIDLPFMLPS